MADPQSTQWIDVLKAPPLRKDAQSFLLDCQARNCSPGAPGFHALKLGPLADSQQR